MNQRQQQFLDKVKDLAQRMDEIYEDAFTLSQSYTEEFKTGADNSIDPTNGLILPVEYTNLGLTFDAVKNVMTKSAPQYVNFYTNLAVTQAEYGKFSRRIMNIR